MLEPGLAQNEFGFRREVFRAAVPAVIPHGVIPSMMMFVSVGKPERQSTKKSLSGVGNALAAGPCRKLAHGSRRVVLSARRLP